jgi:hypothetical protein
MAKQATTLWTFSCNGRLAGGSALVDVIDQRVC